VWRTHAWKGYNEIKKNVLKFTITIKKTIAVEKKEKKVDHLIKDILDLI
jgi:hypothetical protein